MGLIRGRRRVGRVMWSVSARCDTAACPVSGRHIHSSPRATPPFPLPRIWIKISLPTCPKAPNRWAPILRST
jgi:hypothetical protein